MAIINKKSLLYRQSGVTLIEMVVVVAIFAVVSSVLLFNYSDFSTNVSIRNLSQDIALAIRKSQTLATSVKGIYNGTDTYSNSYTYPAYGIAFSLENQNGPFLPNPKSFISFVDVDPGNKKYDSNETCGSIAPGAECLESFSINSADSIVSLETDTGLVTSGSVMITFHRPSPDAIICYIPSGQSSCDGADRSYAKITVKSIKGLTHTISVWNTGQINVE